MAGIHVLPHRHEIIPLLVISAAQLAVLERIPRMLFEDGLLRHFRTYYARECDEAGEQQVRALVSLGVARAAMHGYRTRHAAGLYVNLMFMLGSSFEVDPQIPWAREQLVDRDIGDTLTRIQRLFSSAVRFLEQTAGANEERLHEALRRLQQSDAFAPLIEADAGSDERALVRLVALYPQKVACQGNAATLALVTAAAARARERGLHGQLGCWAFVVNAFFWGIAFDDDPLFPWARRLFTETSAEDEGRLAQRLVSETLGHVGRVLAD